MMERENSKHPLPSPHGFLLQLLPEEIRAPRWKTESWKFTVFTSTWFTWLLAPLSSFCNTHTHGVLGLLLPSTPASASPGAAERPLPGASPAAGAGEKELRPFRCPAAVRKRGTRREESAIIIFFFSYCFVFCR